MVSAAVRVTSNLPLDEVSSSGCPLTMALPFGIGVLDGAHALSTRAAMDTNDVARIDLRMVLSCNELPFSLDARKR